MGSKLPGVLAVLGGVWMLYLYFGAAEVTYFGAGQDDRVEVSCAPFGPMGGTVESFRDPLTVEQREAVSAYVDTLDGTTSREDAERLEADA
ncbi:hypothetical protein [Kribbella sp. CA-247076]|uniref:hypothetical protein n=1 Tax=Kribbella sp. CA-247076 TaxID=3239941 RepID=UPI003D8F349E